jgi:hypothetical protein
LPGNLAGYANELMSQAAALSAGLPGGAGLPLNYGRASFHGAPGNIPPGFDNRISMPGLPTGKP